MTATRIPARGDPARTPTSTPTATIAAPVAPTLIHVVSPTRPSVHGAADAYPAKAVRAPFRRVGLARLARDGGLAGLSDPLEVARVRPQYGDRIVDPVAQTVGKNDILKRLLDAVSLWPWE